MSDATEPGPDEDTKKRSARRLRERVEALLSASPVATRATVVLDGERLDHTVRAEFLPALPEGFDAAVGEPLAAVMATSYVLDDAAASERPVCFAFNGGPGSASIWLHLGALGPKRVVVPDDASMARAPYGVVDNPESWFAWTDLVFLDPPQTGWSLAAGEDARKTVLSVDGDVAALADVVKAWLTRHRRWGSPVFLAGESYGTTRGAALADKLQSAGVALSGLVLVSLAMDLQSLVFAPGNDLPHALFLPGFATVSQFHGLLAGEPGRSPEAARAAAEAFVDETYAAALHAGARLDARARRKVAKRIAELTGLPASLVEEKNLRIRDQDYFVEALRPQGRLVGRLDARATAPVAASRESTMEFDPGIEAIAPAYTMAAMAYFGGTLGLAHEARYEVLSYDAHKAWNWNRGEDRGNSFASTSRDLARAMRRNAHLRVFVASGRYDLGTPYSASDWSLAQLDIGPAERERIVHRHYDAGHMMYTRQADLRRLKADLAPWFAACVGGGADPA